MAVYPLDVEIETVKKKYLKMETKEQVAYLNLENVKQQEPASKEAIVPYANK